MEDDLITTKEVGDYRIKVYYCHDSECPITNWGLFGSFFFEYSDTHRLHDECNWKTFFYDNKHQYYVREAIPTGSKVFYVECNMSYCIGNMLFVTNMLESIKDAIEKYKKARTELSYRDIWETFKNLMDYIEFFDMGTPRRLLKKSANEWLGTNHELSRKSDKIKREYVRELKHIFQILLNHQAIKHWKSLEPLM